MLRLDVPEPAVAPDERKVLVTYGILATLYICAILTVVALTAYGWISGALGAVAGLLFLSAVLLMLRGKIAEGWRTLRTAAREHGSKLRGSPALRRFSAAAIAAALLVLVLPWPITVSGGFTTLPSRALALEAPERAVVSQVMVREGMQVSPGSPLLRLRNLELERDAVNAAREADSLARMARIAFAAGDPGRAATLDAEHRSAAALAQGLAARARALTVRAPSAGSIISERPEELLGRRVEAGTPLLLAGASGNPEARVLLSGAGASLVRAGQQVRLALHDGSTAVGTVESVAPSSDTSSGATEARVRIGGEEWRVGTRGTARITLRRSSIAGAALWRIRSGIRSDILF